MLKQIRPGQTGEPELRIADAVFPAPFAGGLEFNPPAHGTWNIVHTGMLVPEAHQIYVCTENCVRGVVLTAAEMELQHRFSFVVLEERDLMAGELERVTIDGVSACLNKLPKLPPAVLLFTVCVHQFLGCDLDYIYRSLEERFPEVIFVRCFMDCLLQKKGPTPDQKLRKSMYDPIRPLPAQEKLLFLAGSDLPLDPDTDLFRLARCGGGKVQEISRQTSWGSYLELGKAAAIGCTWPAGVMGAEHLAGRLKREYLSLPMSFDYEEIRREWQELADFFDVTGQELIREWPQVTSLTQVLELEQELAEQAIREARGVIGGRPIAIDYTFHPRPLGLARLLISHGFPVERVYLDAIALEEQEDFRWLQKNAPDLILGATIHPACRVLKRNRPDILAAGQKAAWFSGTGHFVNLVQGGGLHGFAGIRSAMALLSQAACEEKDTAGLIVRKGWGCRSCI